VHEGGYNVTSEILSFLSPAHLPVQITPTRWKRDPESLIKFMRDRYERLQEDKSANITVMEAVIDQQLADIATKDKENDLLRQEIAEYEQEGSEESI